MCKLHHASAVHGKEKKKVFRIYIFSPKITFSNPFFKTYLLITYLSKSPLLTTKASMTAMAAYNLFSASSKTMEFSL